MPDAQNAADAAADSYPRVTTAAAVTIASINFVDLAGSERASQTAEVGDKEKLRQKEVRFITAGTQYFERRTDSQQSVS